MIKIGIEINNVIRDYNSQIAKYYKKEFDNTLDISSIPLNNCIITDVLKFKSKIDKHNFIYVDYPYEIFGCANSIHRNLPSRLNDWLDEISNFEDEDVEILLFGLREQALSIQSTYYFLSKSGCRVREVIFPKKTQEVWDRCDVVITTDCDVIENKPDNKKLILIDKQYNNNLSNKAHLIYNSLMEIISDDTFLHKINND